MILIFSVAAVLFLLAFITRRRYGVLGLALSAGALLAESLTGVLRSLLESYNIVFSPLSSTVLAACILILLPSLLLLFGGPRYSNMRMAAAGAVGYALFGTLLLLNPLSLSLSFTDQNARDILQTIARYQPWFVAAAVALAVIDLMHAHGPKLKKPKKSH